MRPTKHEVHLAKACIEATRATCARRRVGCVLVGYSGHVLSTGYNGPAVGRDHCVDYPCAGVGAASGTSLELCEAIHAEQNALLQCRDVREIHTCYCTHSPCVHCIKLLLNTGCRDILYLWEYAHMATVEALWAGRGTFALIESETSHILATAMDTLEHYAHAQHKNP